MNPRMDPPVLESAIFLMAHGIATPAEQQVNSTRPRTAWQSVEFGSSADSSQYSYAEFHKSQDFERSQN